jgi:hypothetical protein
MKFVNASGFHRKSVGWATRPLFTGEETVDPSSALRSGRDDKFAAQGDPYSHSPVDTIRRVGALPATTRGVPRKAHRQNHALNLSQGDRRRQL